MREFYAPLNRNHNKVTVMDVCSAELTKYAANYMLANLAEKFGADIEVVRNSIGLDRRIGYQLIYPGSSCGGSCFPEDVQALVRTANGIDYKVSILEAVEEVNNRQKINCLDI